MSNSSIELIAIYGGFMPAYYITNPYPETIYVEDRPIAPFAKNVEVVIHADTAWRLK